VIAHRLLADRESLRDVVVVEPLRDQFEHLALAFGQIVKSGALVGVFCVLRRRKKAAQLGPQVPNQRGQIRPRVDPGRTDTDELSRKHNCAIALPYANCVFDGQ
jgi:hypothetical protein